LQGDNRSIQDLPWLKLGGKFNPRSLVDRPPYTYWYRVSEIYNLLQSVGFKIVAIGTSPQINADNMNVTDRPLLAAPLSGMLDVVIKK
jgi:hypothetical protein